MPKGWYIACSGGEGAGKSMTLARLEREMPELQGAMLVREPGGTVVAEAIRAILLDSTVPVNDAWTEIFLLMAARRDLTVNQVQPALDAGRIVIADRCWVDTVVYQFFARLRSPDPTFLMQMVDAAQIPYPDLWLWFDVDPEVGLKRRGATSEVNRFDQEALDFHHRVHEGFARMMQFVRINPVRIDANATPDEVFRQAQTAVRDLLDSRTKEATV